MFASNRQLFSCFFFNPYEAKFMVFYVDYYTIFESNNIMNSWCLINPYNNVHAFRFLNYFESSFGIGPTLVYTSS